MSEFVRTATTIGKDNDFDALDIRSKFVARTYVAARHSLGNELYAELQNYCARCPLLTYELLQHLLSVRHNLSACTVA
jgi:hypothetical protein